MSIHFLAEEPLLRVQATFLFHPSCKEDRRPTVRFPLSPPPTKRGNKEQIKVGEAQKGGGEIYTGNHAPCSIYSWYTIHRDKQPAKLWDRMEAKNKSSSHEGTLGEDSPSAGIYEERWTHIALHLHIITVYDFVNFPRQVIISMENDIYMCTYVCAFWETPAYSSGNVDE